MASIVDRFEAMSGGGLDPAEGLLLLRGRQGLEDYAALSRFHYRADRPATVCEVLAFRTREGEAVACVVVSRPTLNAWWRARAWPGEFDGMDKRTAAREVNAKLRTVSRVIVDPRYRGIGLAMRLVRAYLARPLTPLTEAVGTMSRVCPFFERAGMTAHRRGRSKREARLWRVLREERVGLAALLAGEHAGGLAGGRVERALRVWAEASRATRGIRDVKEMARAAAAALRFPPVAYTGGEVGEKLAHRAEARRHMAPHCRGTAAGEWGDGQAGNDSGCGGAARVAAGAAGCGIVDDGAGGWAQRADGVRGARVL